MGKPPASILDGNVWWFGSRDECAEIVDEHFGGRYCLANIGPHHSDTSSFYSKEADFFLGFMWGVCMPRSCAQADFASFMNNLIQEFPKFPSVLFDGNYSVQYSQCEKVGDEWKVDLPASIVL